MSYYLPKCIIRVILIMQQPAMLVIFLFSRIRLSFFFISLNPRVSRIAFTNSFIFCCWVFFLFLRFALEPRGGQLVSCKVMYTFFQHFLSMASYGKWYIYFYLKKKKIIAFTFSADRRDVDSTLSPHTRKTRLFSYRSNNSWI